MGSGDTALYILNLGIWWKGVLSFMSQLLYPWGKSSWYPLDRRLGVPHSCFGCSGKEKKSLPWLCWESNLSHPAHSLFTTLTELYQLLKVMAVHETTTITACKFNHHHQSPTTTTNVWEMLSCNTLFHIPRRCVHIFPVSVWMRKILLKQA
jgi:hypothetical protein